MRYKSNKLHELYTFFYTGFSSSIWVTDSDSITLKPALFEFGTVYFMTEWFCCRQPSSFIKAWAWYQAALAYNPNHKWQPFTEISDDKQFETK